MPSSPSLNAFLKLAKTAFLADLGARKSLSRWVVCVGNEAGDLDSVASAVGMAFLSSSPSNTSKQYIPLILTAQSDLYLRPENVHVFDSISLPISDLLTISDLPTPSLLAQLGASFALVDHNRLLPLFGSAEAAAPGEEQKESRVIAILDHHADEGFHLDASPRTLALVGSCASLVTEHFLLPPSLSSSSSSTSPVTPLFTGQAPSELATLLLSAILIDTTLKPATEGGKATPTDLAAAQFLSEAARGPDIASLSRHASLPERAKALNKIKDNVGHLSGRDLIRRDYKAYTVGEWSYGIATVPVSLSTAWLTPEHHRGVLERLGLRGEPRRHGGWDVLEKDMVAWMTESRLDMLVVTTTFSFKPDGSGAHGLAHLLDAATQKSKKKQHARELVVLVKTKHEQGKLARVFDALGEDGTLRLQSWVPEEVGAEASIGLPPPPSVEGEQWRVWRQGNDRATRKQIAPVLKAILESLLSEPHVVSD